MKAAFPLSTDVAARVFVALGRPTPGGWANTSYQKALGRMVDLAPERFAAIDVGTNSVKFHVGERAADGTWTTVVDRAEITRLGEGLEDRGEIAPEAIERTVAAIAGWRTRRAGSARRRSSPSAPQGSG